jgi:hypothetical protein
VPGSRLIQRGPAGATGGSSGTPAGGRA